MTEYAYYPGGNTYYDKAVDTVRYYKQTNSTITPETMYQILQGAFVYHDVLTIEEVKYILEHDAAPLRGTEVIQTPPTPEPTPIITPVPSPAPSPVEEKINYTKIIIFAIIFIVMLYFLVN